MKQRRVTSVIVAIAISLIVCGAATTAAAKEDIATPYTSRSITSYSEIEPADQGRLDRVNIVSVDCGGNVLCGGLVDKLKATGITLQQGGCRECDAILKVTKDNDNYWGVMGKAGDEWVIGHLGGPRSNHWYSDAVYHVELSLPGLSSPIVSQSTLAVKASKPVDSIPHGFPNVDELTDEVAPIVAASLGHMSLLEDNLNAKSSKVRKAAAALFGEIGNPAAREILEARLKVEKKRSVKGAIKKALKKLK